MRPVQGRNDCVDEPVSASLISIYTPRAGRKRSLFLGNGVIFVISMYAPLEGRNKNVQPVALTTAISMYAPHTGAQHEDKGFIEALGQFQFTCPVRGTTKDAHYKQLNFHIFQCTHPKRGEVGSSREYSEQ